MGSSFDILRDLDVEETPKAQEFVKRPKVPSRGGQVDMNQCMKATDAGRYEIILASARLTREKLKQRRKTEMDPYVTPVDALLEFQSGEADVFDHIRRANKAEIYAYFKSRANEGWTY